VVDKVVSIDSLDDIVVFRDNNGIDVVSKLMIIVEEALVEFELVIGNVSLLKVDVAVEVELVVVELVVVELVVVEVEVVEVVVVVGKVVVNSGSIMIESLKVPDITDFIVFINGYFP